MKTEICITIDTEFSIAGAFQDPERYAPLGERVVDCPANGRDEGLGFLLDVFAEHGVPATFFVEALQTAYFGDAPMGRIVDRIAAKGHDIQLHLHPCWRCFRQLDWKGRIADDSCAGRSDAELDALIGDGLATFSRWGLERPVALRTGGLQTDTALYRAMARAHLALSSSVGLAIYRPAEPQLHLYAGRHIIDGVCEIPVLSYTDLRVGARQHLHSLTITGCSWAEIESLLWQARRAGISPVVLLTHPFEYIKTKDFRYTTLRRNRINQTRLVKLLRFLRAHEGEFTAATFGDRGDAWAAAELRANPSFVTSPLKTASRLIENVVNDHVWHY